MPFADAVTTTRSNALTASFENVPAEHDGENAFSFQVAFSENVDVSYQTLRDDSFTVTEGDITRARRVDGRDDLWGNHGGARLTGGGDNHAAGQTRLRNRRRRLHRRG